MKLKDIASLIDITGDGENVVVEIVKSPAGHEVLYIHTSIPELPTVVRICRVKVQREIDGR